MKITIIIFIAILFLILQEFLSTRNHFVFGLIVPTFILISGGLLLIFTTQHETAMDVYPFVMVLGFSIMSYFNGRKKVKDKKKKELEKMTIKDL